MKQFKLCVVMLAVATSAPAVMAGALPVRPGENAAVAARFDATRTAEVTITRVEVAAGVELRLLESGRLTTQPPLVLIPGWSAGADIWRAQIDAFASSRRVIAVDPRSQGDSTKTTSGNTPEVRAQDLHALLQARGITRPVLVGWSQGVQDVAAYVAKFGTRGLAAVVLVDSTISSGAKSISAAPAAAAMTFERLALYQANQKEYLRGMFRFIISKPLRAEEVERLVATGLKTPTSVGAAMLVADLYGVDRSAALDDVSAPVLVIAAANSPELDAQRSMAARIPGARFEVIDDASHAVFLDQPQRFRTVLEDFLDGIQETERSESVPE
jgi:microsomal epoxide hydrolase